jgi:hypothetical protein
VQAAQRIKTEEAPVKIKNEEGPHKMKAEEAPGDGFVARRIKTESE